MEEISEIQWYLAIHQKMGGFLEDKVLDALHVKLDELKQSEDEV